MNNFDSAFSLSVVIPLYNSAEWIEKTLDHVITQTVRPDEILLIDDGSKDNCAQLVEEIAARHDGWIRLHRKSNQGVAHTRNLGVAMARGQLILLLDHDDLLTPDALEKHLEIWKSTPGIEGTRGLEDLVLVEGYDPPSWLQENWLNVIKPGSTFSSHVLHRTVFDKVGPLDESYEMGSDSDWFARTREQNVLIAPLEHLTTVRQIHGTNHSANITTAHNDLTRALHASILRRRNNKAQAQQSS